METDASKARKITFAGAFLGLLLAPRDTMTKVLFAKKYHFGIMMLVLLLLVIFTPFFVQLRLKHISLYKGNYLKSVVLVSTIAFFLFIFLENIFLRILSLKVSLPGLACAVALCLAPIILMILLIYTLNIHAAQGSFDYMTVALAGFAREDAGYGRALTWIVWMGGFMIFMDFLYALKYLGGDMFTANAAIITLLSVIPLFGAVLISIVMANIFLPGTVDLYRELIVRPGAILNV
jgi:hypothetical protein